MASALLRRILPSNGTPQRCLVAAITKRTNPIVSSAAASTSCSHDVSYPHQQRDGHHSLRYFSKYASVDHSAAYQHEMSSSHGTQLQMALEEGRGKDTPPFDPFSQYLDAMGDASETLPNDVVLDDEGNVIQEAEYETIEEYDEDDDEDEEEESDDDDDDGDNIDDGPIYTNTGALYRPKSERKALKAGYPAGGSFAVINLAGFQHKVTVDDLLVVNKLKPVSHWSVGSTHTIKNEDILLMANQDKTLVGLPGVRGGEVDVMVEEITRDKTMIIFKKRRRKHSRRKNGFRRQVTFLRVLDVRMPGEVANSQGVKGEGDDGGLEVGMAA